MVLQNLYYYSWYPEVSTTANAEIISLSSAASGLMSKWPWNKLPGKRLLGWILLAFLVILIAVICCVALLTTSPATPSSPPKPLEEPSTANILILTDHVSEDGRVGRSENVTAGAIADKACPLDHFKCELTGKCVPISAYCNGERDCGEDDLTDEPIDAAACNCRHYLKLASPEKVCDPTGACHCPDRSDCRGCPCTETSFLCSAPGGNISSDCIPPQLVCDGKVDCSTTGRDEENCLTLSKSPTFHDSDLGLEEDKSAEGFVLVRMKGVWHSYCSNDWAMNVFHSICLHLRFGTVVDFDLEGLSEFHSKQELEAENVEDRPQLIVAQEEGEETGFNFKIIRANETKGRDEAEWSLCKIAYLRCRM